MPKINPAIETDKEIEALAAEAESGYDVDALLARLGKRGAPSFGLGTDER
jgi:hypothetical protein